MNMIASIAANPTYRLIAVGIAGFAIGFWTDYLLGLFLRARLPAVLDTSRTSFANETIYLPDFLKAGSLLSAKLSSGALFEARRF